MTAGRLTIRGILLIAVFGCSVIFAPRFASAQTSYTWNLSGDGIWDDATPNWTTGSGPTVWSDGTGTNTAIFGGTAGTITLGASVDPGTIDFNTTGYILAAPDPNTGNYQIGMSSGAPAINVGSGNGAFTATINADIDPTSLSAPLVITNTASGSAATNTQLNLGGSLTVDSGSLTLVGNATASITGTTSTFTVSAPSLSLQTLTFNTKAFNTVTLSPATAGATLTLTGESPTINVGVSGATTTGLFATINQNVTTTSTTAPLTINNYSTGSGGALASQQLNLGGPASTISIGLGSLRINNPTASLFTVNAPSFSLNTLTLVPVASGGVGQSQLAGASANSVVTFTGTTPTINFGNSANITGDGSVSHLYETVNVAPSAGPLVIMNNDAVASRSAISFGNGTIANATSTNAFPNGLALYSTSGDSPAYDTSLAATGGAVRLNFNLPGANGNHSLGTDGPISVFSNGAIITDEGSQAAFTLNMTNNVILNAGNLVPTNGDFVTAIGGTKASTGNTVVDWSGVISDPKANGTGTGVGDVLIGNDLVEGSGGAGVTQFSNQMTYSGATIVNNSTNGILDLTVANALPATTILIFGHSSPHDLTPLSNTIGSVDINGNNQTITSLISDVAVSSGISGITNSNQNANVTPILTITGSTVDTYTGGIGIAVGTNYGASGYGKATNNLGLTRAGSGTTILGATNSSNNALNPSTYTGPTTVGDSANTNGNNATVTLEAGSTEAFTVSSNYTVYGTLDLGNYNNGINSLASANSAGAQGVVTTSANPVGNPNNPSSGATLTIGSNTTLNANTTPTTTFYGVLQDDTGTGGPLSLVKAGHGTQTLAGVNTYSGATTINGGTLSLASTGSLSALSSVAVNSGGTLAGSGNAQGSVNINSSGVIAPGSSTAVGGLSVGSLDLFGGSIYNWKLSNAASNGAAGIDYDTVTSAGALTLDSSITSSSPVNVNVSALNLTNFSKTTQQSWTLVSAPSLTGTFASSDFNVVATNFTAGNLFSTFSVSNPTAGNLVLTYNPGSPPPVLTWVGGAGNWDPSGGTSWTPNGGSGGPWNSASGADFNTGSGTVNLTVAISAPLITFDVDGYTIGGTSPLTATSGYSSLTVQVTNNGTTATINAPINSPLTKIGAGTLVLGGTTSTFGSSNSATVSAGILSGTTASLTANINNNGAVVFDQMTSGSYTAAISGSGQVAIQNSAGTGSPVVTFTGSNSYGGATTIGGNATLSIASSANIGGSGAGLTLDGGTLRTTVNSGISFGGALNVTANGGALTDAAPASTTSFAGGANLQPGAVFNKNGPGTLQIVGNGWTGSGSIVINSGSLLVGNEGDLNSNPSTLLGGNSLTLGNNTVFTIAAGNDSAASVTPPNLTLNGNVTLALYATNLGQLNPKLNSTTTINPGSNTASSTITIANSTDFNNALAGSSNVTLGNTTFAPTSGAVTIQTVANGGSLNGNPNLSSASTGLIFGAVTDNGDATTFLGEGNNSTSPAAQPVGIQFNGVASGTTPTLTGPWTIGDTGDTNGQIVVVAVQLVNNAQLAMTTGNITVYPGSQLSITPAAGVYGPTSGSQTITLYGPGPATLTGNSTGALTIGGKSTVEFNSNVNFVLGNSVMVGGMPVSTGHVDIVLSDGSNTKSTILQFDGSLTGAAGLELQGGGDADNFSQVIFAGNNNLTGSTTIKGGEVIVNSGSSIGTGSLTMAQTSAHQPILVLSNPTQSIKNLSSQYGEQTAPGTAVTQTIQLNGTALTINETDFTGMADYGSAPQDFAGAVIAGSQSIITGGGSIVYNGAPAGNGNPAAYLSLSSVNTYQGGTTVESGTLATTLGGTLGTGPVNVSGGVLDLSSAAISVGPLAVGSGGTLNIGLGNLVTSTGAANFAGTLNISGTPANSSYELIAYSGSPTGMFASATGFPGYALVYASGQLDLQSYSAFDNTSGNTTTVNAGVDFNGGPLQVGGGGSTVINGPVQFDGAAVTVSNGSSLAINGQPTFNSGTVAVNSGKLTINNNTNIAAAGTGNVTITVAPAATVQLAGTASALTSTVNVTNNGSTAAGGGLNVTGTNQVVGAVSGTAMANGDGTTTYSGDTVVGPGASLTATQILQNTLTIGAGASVVIAPSGPGISTGDSAQGNSDSGAIASAAASSAASGASGDASDALTAIQQAIDTGTISSTTGERLENRIAAIERLVATDPGLDAGLLESHVLASIPSSSVWSSSGSAPIGEIGAGLLAIDSSSFASASGSETGGTTGFSSAAGITDVPEPSDLLLCGLGAIALLALGLMRRLAWKRVRVRTAS